MGLSIVLLIAFIGSNLIYAAMGERLPVLDGPPGDLLFLAAFSGFQDEWELYEGQQSARIQDEQLELVVSAAQTAAWSTARYHFGDFDVRVAARAIAGPVDNAFGLLFGVQDQSERDCDMPAIVLCGIDQLSPLAGAAIRQALNLAVSRDYFAFLISSDGYYSFWKTQNGKTQMVSAWIPAPQIKEGLGELNILRAIGHDLSYRFWLNGSPVELCLPDDPELASTYYGGECIDGSMRAEYRDSRLTVGKIGLVAQSTATGGGGITLRFDNLVVFQPADRGEDVKL